MIDPNFSETQWSSFYVDRVNNMRYLDMFKDKYKALLLFIDRCIADNPNLIVKEEGCGIGNVSKAHFIYGKNKPKEYILSDIDNSMLKLAHKNTLSIHSPVSFINESILDPKDYVPNTLVITHGVLEHFCDEDIEKILKIQSHPNVVHSGHYVPLDGYKTPSFGDERLLSFEFWVSFARPRSIALMENDLFMFIK